MDPFNPLEEARQKVLLELEQITQRQLADEAQRLKLSGWLKSLDELIANLPLDRRTLRGQVSLQLFPDRVAAPAPAPQPTAAPAAPPAPARNRKSPCPHTRHKVNDFSYLQTARAAAELILAANRPLTNIELLDGLEMLGHPIGGGAEGKHRWHNLQARLMTYDDWFHRDKQKGLRGYTVWNITQAYRDVRSVLPDGAAGARVQVAFQERPTSYRRDQSRAKPHGLAGGNQADLH